MSRMNFYKLRHTGKPIEAPKAKPITGCWTHIAREPVRTFTAEENALWMEGKL